MKRISIIALLVVCGVLTVAYSPMLFAAESGGTSKSNSSGSTGSAGSSKSSSGSSGPAGSPSKSSSGSTGGTVSKSSSGSTASKSTSAASSQSKSSSGGTSGVTKTGTVSNGSTVSKSSGGSSSNGGSKSSGGSNSSGVSVTNTSKISDVNSVTHGNVNEKYTFTTTDRTFANKVSSTLNNGGNVPQGMHAVVTSNRDGTVTVSIRPDERGSSSSNGGTPTPKPGTTDRAPLGDLLETLGGGYKGPNTSCEAIAGWSCDRDFPENPVSIQMYVDNNLYTTFSTANPYPSVIAPSWAPSRGIACGPSVRAPWGFRYVTPTALKDGKSHTVKLIAINQGPKGSALNVSLPNESWTHPKSFTLHCPVPGSQTNDLVAALDNPGDQTAGVLFTISPSVVNLGKEVTKNPFALKIEIDKSNSAAATSWGYKAPGADNIGDVSYQTVIPTGLSSSTPTVHDFTNITLAVGDYRVRAIADPDFVVESATSSERANNTTNWFYFTVTAGTTTIPDTIETHSDLSFESFAVTGTCDIASMAGNVACPATTVSFVLLNGGDEAIDAGVGVPYRIEAQKDGAVTWSSVKTGVYNDAIDAKAGGVDGRSAEIAVSIPGLKLGTTKLRAVVNHTHKAALHEVNFDNNISNEVGQSYLFDVATVTLKASDEVIRYGSKVTLSWSVDAQYRMRCTVTGDFDAGKTVTFTTTPGHKSGSLTSSSLHNTQHFNMSCAPQAAAGVPPDIVTKSTKVEVIPLVQET